MSLWQFHNVSLGTRLQSVSLEIRPGLTAVVGPSGAGKTSLLNLLVGYERPTTGQLTQTPAMTGRLPLFWVPPDHGLWPDWTVREHLYRVAPPTHRDSCPGLLRDFGLSPLAEAKPTTLSEGERARLAVARALASQAATIVMDEPLIHVDPARNRDCWRVLRNAVESSGTSLVFSSHQPEVVRREAQHAVCLVGGSVRFSGSVAELVDEPPSLELAELLGPCNWLDEAVHHTLGAALSGRAAEGHPCVRPERLVCRRDNDAGLKVTSWRDCMSYAEVIVQSADGSQTALLCRPEAAPCQQGDRVMFQILPACERAAPSHSPHVPDSSRPENFQELPPLRQRKVLLTGLWSLLLPALMILSGCGSDDERQLNLNISNSLSLPAVGPRLPAPRGMGMGTGDQLLVLDNAGRILAYNPAGKLQRTWWMPAHEVGRPEGIIQLRRGGYAVADTHYHRVVIFDADCQPVRYCGSEGTEPGQFIFPVAVTEDDSHNLYVAEYGSNDRVQKFDEEGKFLLQFGTCGSDPGQFQRPSGIVWHDGLVDIADAFNNRLQRYQDDGKFVKVLASSETGVALNYPYNIARGPEGDLYVIEYGAGRLSRFTEEGKLVGRFGKIGTGMGEFKTPWGLTVDSTGRVWVADTGNGRIVELVP